MKPSMLSGLLGPIQTGNLLALYGQGIGASARLLAAARNQAAMEGAGTPGQNMSSRFGNASEVALSRSAIGKLLGQDVDVPPVGKLAWVTETLDSKALRALKRAVLNGQSFIDQKNEITDKDRTGEAKGWVDILSGINSAEAQAIEKSVAEQDTGTGNTGDDAQKTKLAQALGGFFTHATPGAGRLVEERLDGLLKTRMSAEILRSTGPDGTLVAKVMEQMFDGARSEEALYIRERLENLIVRMKSPQADLSMPTTATRNERDAQDGKKGAVFTLVDANNARLRIELSTGPDGAKKDGSLQANWVSQDLGSIEIAFSRTAPESDDAPPQGEGRVIQRRLVKNGLLERVPTHDSAWKGDL